MGDERGAPGSPAAVRIGTTLPARDHPYVEITLRATVVAPAVVTGPARATRT
ncbi:hypothetical protein ABZT17_23710 [Streptomyces sp. NPDC005648]|uniref:hypothetical protein n=1 Tax=Streptomyces sp. NPDC005648 TaxID=3157044 RepID=UPI0033BF6858